MEQKLDEIITAHNEVAEILDNLEILDQKLREEGLSSANKIVTYEDVIHQTTVIDDKVGLVLNSGNNSLSQCYKTYEHSSDKKIGVSLVSD